MVINVQLILHLVAIMLLGHSLARETLPPPTVCTTHAGCMMGKLMPGYRIDSFEAFMGIPFALPPVGELRFSHPRPYSKSNGTLNATEPKEECIQKYGIDPNAEVSGVEDCLYLNVYRPQSSAISGVKKLPVMVYIHGGGWYTGSANPGDVGPEYFMDTQEVILVTIAYRLGIFGFLSTNDSVIPGNFGMKDQTMALKWVQQNIADFGGDPKQVTLFGQSAGGTSSHLHMLSKHSEGLFQAVIAQSGTASLPIAFSEDPLAVAQATAEHCNIVNASALSSSQLLEALRSVDVKTLLAAVDRLKYWDIHPVIVYGLVVENSHSKEAFLTEHPLLILAKGNYKPVRYMAGIVAVEGGLHLPVWEFEYLRKSFNENFDYLLERFVQFPQYFNRSQVDAAMVKIIDEYFEGKHELSKQGFIDLYVFNYTGSYSYKALYSENLTNLDYGVVHGDESIYLFRSPFIFPDFPKNSTDAMVSQALVRHFVNFAANRNSTPNPKCNKANFPENSLDSICEYVTFRNGPSDSYMVETDNKFNVRRMRIWDEILQYEY